MGVGYGLFPGYSGHTARHSHSGLVGFFIGCETFERYAYLFSSFAIVAASEEMAKCAVLLIGAFPRKFFNEPMDGIVYAVLVAMGFATVENLFYANNFGMQTTLVRAFTAVPAHFVFAIVQGYYIGLAKFNPERQVELILQGLGLSIFMHGVYDFLILQELSSWLSVLASISVYACLFYCAALVRKHLDISPFKS